MAEIILTELKYLIGILLAMVLGFAIGFERKLRYKEAGIRTHTIVCVGAALMVVVSKYGFEGMGDASRVAAQIVSGVGFLGAGTIMLRGQKMSGLTTAAGVWAAAGVGMAAGAGLYIVATGATVIMIAVQCILHINCRAFRPRQHYLVRVVFRHTEDESTKVKELFSVEQFNKLTIERAEGHTVYNAVLHTKTLYSSDTINQIMQDNKFILAIERCDTE